MSWGGCEEEGGGWWPDEGGWGVDVGWRTWCASQAIELEVRSVEGVEMWYIHQPDLSVWML